MGGIIIQCSSERDGVRCQRRVKYIHPKGASAGLIWTCSGCSTGHAPFVAKESARKGQQKQAKKK